VGENRTHFKHILSALGGRAVDGERVVFVVDGAPVRQDGFERSFDFPVLDEVLHDIGEGAGFVVLLFRYYTRSECEDGLRDMLLHLLSANILRVLE
jgi:hypothetical protein